MRDQTFHIIRTLDEEIELKDYNEFELGKDQVIAVGLAFPQSYSQDDADRTALQILNMLRKAAQCECAITY